MENLEKIEKEPFETKGKISKSKKMGVVTVSLVAIIMLFFISLGTFFRDGSGPLGGEKTVIPHKVGVSSIWEEKVADSATISFSYEIGVILYEGDEIQSFRIEGVADETSPNFEYLALEDDVKNGMMEVIIKNREIVRIQSTPVVADGRFYPERIYWKKE